MKEREAEKSKEEWDRTWQRGRAHSDRNAAVPQGLSGPSKVRALPVQEGLTDRLWRPATLTAPGGWMSKRTPGFPSDEYRGEEEIRPSYINSGCNRQTAQGLETRGGIPE